MTVARRRAPTFTALTASPPALELPAPMPAPLYTPTPRDVPAAETVTPAGRLRRCTFRRIDLVGTPPSRSSAAAYEVMCLYGGEAAGLALGDLDAARPTCDACRHTGIFRPDEA